MNNPTKFLNDEEAKNLILQFVEQNGPVDDTEVYEYLQACTLAIARGEMVRMAAAGYGVLTWIPPDKFAFALNKRGRAVAREMLDEQSS